MPPTSGPGLTDLVRMGFGTLRPKIEHHHGGPVPGIHGVCGTATERSPGMPAAIRRLIALWRTFKPSRRAGVHLLADGGMTNPGSGMTKPCSCEAFGLAL